MPEATHSDPHTQDKRSPCGGCLHMWELWRHLRLHKRLLRASPAAAAALPVFWEEAERKQAQLTSMAPTEIKCRPAVPGDTHFWFCSISSKADKADVPFLPCGGATGSVGYGGRGLVTCSPFIDVPFCYVEKQSESVSIYRKYKSLQSKYWCYIQWLDSYFPTTPHKWSEKCLI